jgi:nitroimidazol reductase NimA-like FMN-containing flavoprotein (pyridoxamine 5'-phosphate oxidase superfamily)
MPADQPADHALRARAMEIIEANLYVVLGTADEDGQPWASPVYYAADGAREFYWMSLPDTTHSRNLARRPRISMVVFDSTVRPGTGEAVYMSATAEELSGPDIERGLQVYPGPPERGARRMAAEDMRPPAPHRLYRAVVSEHWMLCPRTPDRQPLCAAHQLPYDHRTPVSL